RRTPSRWNVRCQSVAGLRSRTMHWQQRSALRTRNGEDLDAWPDRNRCTPASRLQSTAMFLYLTTTGRRTGLRRDIEIWFTERDGRFYLIAEHRDRASWVRNIRANAQVHVRVGDRRFGALARIVNDEQEP